MIAFSVNIHVINIIIKSVLIYFTTHLLIYTKLYQIHEELYQLARKEQKHKELYYCIQSKVICTFMSIWHRHGKLCESIKLSSK